MWLQRYYILLTRDIAVIDGDGVTFKKCAPFTKYITKIDGITTDDDEDLELVMPMYNLMEYSSNYSETTGSLWFYSKDNAINIANADNANDDDFKSFKCKAELLGNTSADGVNEILRNASIAVPWKYLCNFLEITRNAINWLKSRIKT